MPRFNINHVTRYTYEEPVRDSANQVILFPIRDQYQEVIKQELKVTGDAPVDIFKDYYGNEIGTFSYTPPHVEMVIDSKVEVVVKHRPMPADDAGKGEQWKQLAELRYTYPYIDFIKQEQFNALHELKDLPAMSGSRSMTPLQAAMALNDYIFKNFSYNKGVTDVETTLDEVWKLKAGVCQDFAHMLLVLLRMIDIPARYVSGYICPNKNGMRGEGATHAWVDAYIPFYGWLGFDPTNNCLVNDLHVRLATGRSFRDVSPVKGTYKGAPHHKLEVGVTVSYESDSGSPETPAAVMIVQQGKPGASSNSYRRHLEMIQQQQ